MTDSFSSVCDSARNFLRRRWPWVVGALALTLAISAFLCRDWLAMYLGYEKTDLSPGARFLRDLFIGIAAILGIVMAGWRNFALDRQSKAAQEQAKIGNQQAQHDRDRIAGEQFSGAVKLLAQKDAKNKPAIDARIGGIYSLQTLANNRIKEYGAQVVKTLISYVKQNAQLTAQPPLIENETPKETRASDNFISNFVVRPSPDFGVMNARSPQEARALGEDVKTAFNVLEQLLAAREEDSAEWNEPADGIKLSDQDLSFSGQDFSWLDLSASQVGGLHRYIWSQVNLQGANLSEAQLQGAKLLDAQLQDAILFRAQLQHAEFHRAQLQGADLLEARLPHAILFRAQLQGADLARAHLHGTDLSGAQLQGARLSNAQLQGAKLYMAQLQGANLSGAQLQGAKLSRADLQNADLSRAKLDDKTTLPSNLSGKIWHFGEWELPEIDSLSPDAEWDLSLFFRSGYALVGVLRNFSGRQIFLVGNGRMRRTKKLRLAARELLSKPELPNDFPQDWQDWLGRIESDGSHPNDPKPLD